MAVPSVIKRIKGYERFRRSAIHAFNRVRHSKRERRKLVADYLARNDPAKLNIGCGSNILSGWLNTEFEELVPRGVLYLDATRPFPFADASFDLVFSEHMIEHVPLAGAANMLRECHRVLKSGGRIRIGTPRLEFMLELLSNPTEAHETYADLHFQDFTEEPEVRTPARIMNDYYRMWGHQFVYDEPTLRLLLERAGFVGVRSEAVGESADPRLRGIENEGRMTEGMLALTTLVLEAEKA